MDRYKLFEVKAPIGEILTYCYVVETKNFIIMIDSGVVSACEKIETILDEIAQPQKKLLIINTHEHWDHTALNGYFQKKGAIVAAHISGRKWMKDKNWHFSALYERFFSEYPPEQSKKDTFWVECGEPSMINVALCGGEIIEDDGIEMHIIHTPGHSNGSLCIYEKNTKVVFSGDSIQGFGYFGNLPFYMNATAYEKTLRTISDVEFVANYGGHNQIIGKTNVKDYLHESLAGFQKNDAVIRKIVAGSNRGKTTLAEIANLTASELNVKNNIQLYTTVAAQMKYIIEV